MVAIRERGNARWAFCVLGLLCLTSVQGERNDDRGSSDVYE